MLTAKQVADLITWSRALVGLTLVWLGFTQGSASLPLAVWLMIADWTSDSVDGVLARRSRVKVQTWIGSHDLQVDMWVSAGLLAYMVAAGYWGLIPAEIYLIFWLAVFWRYGVVPALGMLYQAPIYGWFIWISLREPPSAGIWILIWIASAVIITWPKFPNLIIPGFLAGMRQVWERSKHRFL